MQAAASIDKHGECCILSTMTSSLSSKDRATSVPISATSVPVSA